MSVLKSFLSLCWRPAEEEAPQDQGDQTALELVKPEPTPVQELKKQGTNDVSPQQQQLKAGKVKDRLKRLTNLESHRRLH
jgi:hypothetical protein